MEIRYDTTLVMGSLRYADLCPRLIVIRNGFAGFPDPIPGTPLLSPARLRRRAAVMRLFGLYGFARPSLGLCPPAPLEAPRRTAVSPLPVDPGRRLKLVIGYAVADRRGVGE